MPPKAAVRTQLIDLGGVAVHQLLCGREIANKRRNPPEDGALWRVWEFAESMRNFVYIIIDVQTKEALVLDGCWDVDGIFGYAERLGVKVTRALYTHAHFDHIGGHIPTTQTGGIPLIVSGVQDFVRRSVPVWAGEKDVATICRQCLVPPEKIQVAQEGECLHVGLVRCTVFATPGHTPGSVCLYIPPTGRAGNETLDAPGVRVVAKEGVLLSGDTLFVQGCGRTDLPESSQDDIMRSLSKLIQGLPDGCVVCPGHDYASDPLTTIARERASNQMVNMGLQAHHTPGRLPDSWRCTCAERLRKTAADFMSKPELQVSGVTGGEILLDGVPAYVTVADLRDMVFEHLTDSIYAPEQKRKPQSAEALTITDGSGEQPMSDDMLLSAVSASGRGFVVAGAQLQRTTLRRPWFPPNCDVVIDGLKSSPELNGQAARVSDWVAEKGRYEVLVTAVAIRDTKHVKPDNLRRAMAMQARAYVPEGFGGVGAPAPGELVGGAGSVVDEVWRVVFHSKVAVRAEPSLTGRILASRKPGDRVRVCQRQGEWVRLHEDEGFGSMHAWLLLDGSAKGLGKLLEREEAPAWPELATPSLSGGYPHPPTPPEATGLPATPSPAPRPAAATPVATPGVRPAAAGGRSSASAPAAAASRLERLRGLHEELEHVEMEKAAAIEDEDFDLAAEMKKRQKELEARIRELEEAAADEAAARLEALREELQRVKAEKLAAVAEEDFKRASALKKRQQEVEADLKRLEGGGA